MRLFFVCFAISKPYFIFVCFEIWFLFGMGLWKSFLNYVIWMGSKFFYSIRHFLLFYFSPLDVEKTGERNGKEFDKNRFFLGCFVQGNETDYSSMLFVLKIENFCFIDKVVWEWCWISVWVQRKMRNFLISVYFIVRLIILNWFYAFWNVMSIFLFIEYLFVFWIFIYF